MGGREGEREGRLMYVHVRVHVWVGEGVGEGKRRRGEANTRGS